jgi:hypothetical protein
MTQYAPAERLLVLTFYGVLIYEMSFWDKTDVISPVFGDSGIGERKTNVCWFIPASSKQIRKLPFVTSAFHTRFTPTRDGNVHSYARTRQPEHFVSLS